MWLRVWPRATPGGRLPCCHVSHPERVGTRGLARARGRALREGVVGGPGSGARLSLRACVHTCCASCARGRLQICSHGTEPSAPLGAPAAAPFPHASGGRVEPRWWGSVGRPSPERAGLAAGTSRDTSRRARGLLGTPPSAGEASRRTLGCRAANAVVIPRKRGFPAHLPGSIGELAKRGCFARRI